jgi:hypothetical protein
MVGIFLLPFFFFIVVVLGVCCDIYKSSYNISKLNSPLHHSLLCSCPHSGIVSACLIFPFSYMCTQYFHCVHPPTPFPYILPLSTDTNPLDRICSALLFSNFVKEKNAIFVCLDSYIGSFLVTFACIDGL